MTKVHTTKTKVWKDNKDKEHCHKISKDKTEEWSRNSPGFKGMTKDNTDKGAKMENIDNKEHQQTRKDKKHWQIRKDNKGQ